jgi:hypothetical protein
MRAQQRAGAIHINARTRVGSNICVVVPNRAGRAAPERVLGVAQELAHGDVAIGPSPTHRARRAQGVGKGAGPETGGRRRDAEACQLEGSALAF